MLIVGQLIAIRGHSGKVLRGVVRRVDRRTATATVETHKGYVEISSKTDKDPRCRIVAKVADDWPVALLHDSRKLGALVSISHEGKTLRLFADYAPTIVGVRPASVFLNPALGLSVGDVLIATYERGPGRIDVRRKPATVAQRAKAAEKPKAPESVYERIADDEDPY